MEGHLEAVVLELDGVDLWSGSHADQVPKHTSFIQTHCQAYTHIYVHTNAHTKTDTQTHTQTRTHTITHTLYWVRGKEANEQGRRIR